jgi:hypothetical protein
MTRVTVSGAGYSSVNGLYVERGDYAGKPYYTLYGVNDTTDVSVIRWTGGAEPKWQIFDSGGDEPYFSEEDVDFPWLVQNWTVNTEGVGEAPAPTVALQEIEPETAVVSGAGSEEFNGLYLQTSVQNGRFKYLLETEEYTYNITWGGEGWELIYDGQVFYYSESDVDFPWLAENWLISDGEAPAPTVTLFVPEPEPETENTFGLPAETVALITSRFGTVANFLRLRNQGQI